MKLAILLLCMVNYVHGECYREHVRPWGEFEQLPAKTCDDIPDDLAGGLLPAGWFPDGWNAIPDNALANCNKFTKVQIPGHIQAIGKKAFYKVPLTEIDFSRAKDLTCIDDYAFHAHNFMDEMYLLNFTGAYSLTHIEKGAFYGKQRLTVIDFYDAWNLESIGESAFQYNRLTDLDFINNPKLTNVGKKAFYKPIISPAEGVRGNNPCAKPCWNKDKKCKRELEWTSLFILEPVTNCETVDINPKCGSAYTCIENIGGVVFSGDYNLKSIGDEAFGRDAAGGSYNFGDYHFNWKSDTYYWKIWTRFSQADEDNCEDLVEGAMKRTWECYLPSTSKTEGYNAWNNKFADHCGEVQEWWSFSQYWGGGYECRVKGNCGDPEWHAYHKCLLLNQHRQTKDYSVRIKYMPPKHFGLRRLLSVPDNNRSLGNNRSPKAFKLGSGLWGGRPEPPPPIPQIDYNDENNAGGCGQASSGGIVAPVIIPEGARFDWNEGFKRSHTTKLGRSGLVGGSTWMPKPNPASRSNYGNSQEESAYSNPCNEYTLPCDNQWNYCHEALVPGEQQIKWVAPTRARCLIQPDEHGHISSSYLRQIGIMDIPDNVFNGCPYLKSIELPVETKRIGHSAFQNSGLTSIVIPEGVEYIGNKAFADTKLTSVVIPSTVKTVGDNAFSCIVDGPNSKCPGGKVFDGLCAQDGVEHLLQHVTILAGKPVNESAGPPIVNWGDRVFMCDLFHPPAWKGRDVDVFCGYMPPGGIISGGQNKDNPSCWGGYCSSGSGKSTMGSSFDYSVKYGRIPQEPGGYGPDESSEAFEYAGGRMCGNMYDSKYLQCEGYDIYCQNKFKKCDPGKYFAGGGAMHPGECLTCPDKHFQPDYESNATECTPWSVCPKGYHKGSSTKTMDSQCEPCPDGYYQPDDDTTEQCKPWSTCPSGQYISGGSTTTDGTCIPCDNGYQPEDESRATSCTPWSTCGRGYYKTSHDSFQDGICEPCVDGYQPDEYSNATSCRLWSTCGKGTYKTGSTISSDGTCEGCPHGKYQPNDNSTATFCTLWPIRCDAGKYIFKDGNGFTCKTCPHGTYQPDDSSPATSCMSWDGKRFPSTGVSFINDNAKAKWEDVPVATPEAIDAMLKSDTAEDMLVTYSKEGGPCKPGKICFNNSRVLECPSNILRLSEDKCSSKKEDLYAALQSHCPL